MKPTVTLLDKNNEYFPYWVIVRMTKEKLILVLTLVILFWTFIYKKNIFQYNSSPFIGLSINLFLVLFYYLLIHTNFDIYANLTSNRWISVNMPKIYPTGSTDLVTDLGKFKHEIDIKKDGLVVGHDFVKEHKLDVKPMYKLYSSSCAENKTYKKEGWFCINANDKQQERVSKLINYKESDMSAQGYDIMSITFTLSTLIYNGFNKTTLFQRLIVPLFKFVIVPAISIVYLQRVLYNEDKVLDIVVNNYMILFLTVSVIIAIIIDVINFLK